MAALTAPDGPGQSSVSAAWAGIEYASIVSTAVMTEIHFIGSSFCPTGFVPLPHGRGSESLRWQSSLSPLWCKETLDQRESVFQGAKALLGRRVVARAYREIR